MPQSTNSNARRQAGTALPAFLRALGYVCLCLGSCLMVMTPGWGQDGLAPAPSPDPIGELPSGSTNAPPESYSSPVFPPPYSAPYSAPQQPAAPMNPLQGGVEQTTTLPPQTPPENTYPPRQYPAPSYPQNPSLPYGRMQQPQLAPGWQEMWNRQKTLPGFIQQNLLPGLIQQNQLNGQAQQPSMAPQQAPLQGRAKQDDRPSWLPGWAYSNDTMVAPYHNNSVLFWDRSPMPNRPQWMRLAPSVTKYWKGFVSEPCLVYSEPMESAPGNFTFKSPHPMGPRGWLQVLEKTNPMGFPMYRYWLDQPH